MSTAVAATFAMVAAMASGPVSTPATYYLSPSGNDSNPGTSAKPWKTLNKAALSLTSGQTVILADGDYRETKVTNFSNGNVTVRSANPLKARVLYSADLSYKIYITKPSVSIQGLDISTVGYLPVNTHDSLLTFAKGSDGGKSLGNRLHRVYEDGIKLSQTSNMTIQGNDVFDVVDEGIDGVNVADSIISNNKISGVGRYGILVKGGSRNVAITKNEVRSYNGSTLIGIVLGGSTVASSVYIPNGYEGYNLVASGNYIASDGSLKYGLAFYGCYTCKTDNNYMSGIGTGVLLSNGGDKVRRPNVNPVVYKTTIKYRVAALKVSDRVSGSLAWSSVYASRG